jgi:PKD repeat protein
MRKLFLLLPIILILFSSNLYAQVTGIITFSDTFSNGITYCPSNSQYSNWGNFRSKLDTSSFKLLKVTMRGTYDVSGRTCSDSFAVRRLAARLKNPINGVDLSIKCGSYTWVVAGLGNCISGGSCANLADNVGVSADGSSGACNCLSPSYQMRPIVGNSNWGGINTSSCPGPSQRMSLEFEYRLYQIDAAAVLILPPNICENPNPITVKIKNFGYKTLDSVRIYWSLNNVLQNITHFTNKLPSLKDTILTLKSGINFNPYTNYNIKVWTSNPNGVSDNYTNNDTLMYKFSFIGIPYPPKVNDTSICGSGSKIIYGNPVNANDSLVWFETNMSNKIIGVGKYFKTSFITPGNYKYFVGSVGKLLQNSIQTNFSGGNQQAGFMLNIKALKTNSIDSIGINVGAAAGTKVNIEVYYRDSSYEGYENTQAGWISIGKYSAISKGTGNPTIVPASFSIPIGKCYGFYIQTTSAPSYYLQYGNLSSSVISDSVFQLTTGCGVALNWGTVFPGRNGNIKFFYKNPSCVSSRDSMVLSIKARLNGSQIIKSTPFNTPNYLSTGTQSDPYIVSTGNELNFEILPPFGHSNKGYDSSWKVAEIKVLNLHGKSINIVDTDFSTPTNSANGKLKLIPRNNVEDSLFKILITLHDLVTNVCDTSLERYIYIAPKPNIKLSFNNVCLGSPIEFNNKSTISKGNLRFRWDFGTNDTSNLVNPKYSYTSFGEYDVKLTAISNYGIIKDTIIKVTIFEIPSIKFKTTNACGNDSVILENTTTISKGKLIFKWNLGNGFKSNATSLKYHYDSVGSYIVSLKASANGCSDSLSKKVHQFFRPIANIEINGNCSNNKIIFKNNSTIGLGDHFGSFWVFGDGNSSNDENPTHSYIGSGNKIIKYKATSQFGCVDSIVKIIDILPSPLASFNNSPTCNILPVVFSNNTIEPSTLNTSYIWYFGDGDSSIVKHPQHLYSRLGKYQLKLIATSTNNCSSTYQKELNILEQPIVNFETVDGCSGNYIAFTNKTVSDNLITFKWKFGDGDSSFLSSPLKKYTTNTPSTYNVTLIAGNIEGCKDTLIKPVNIKEAANCQFTYNSAGTGGFEYKFVPKNTNYPFYLWNFGNEATSKLTSPNYKFNADGKFRIKVTMRTADGCECVDSSNYVLVNHLGADETKINTQFYIYPNPNNGNFSIQFSNVLNNNASIKIFNIAGKLVYFENNITKSKFLVSVSYLNNGIYFIEMEDSEGLIARQKLLINH